MTPDVCVIGLGYVGLPSVLIFAFKGCRVIGVDVDKRKVDMVNAGMPYIREPKLEEILFEVLKSVDFKLQLITVLLVSVVLSLSMFRPCQEQCCRSKFSCRCFGRC